MARLWVLVDRRALIVTALCLVVWRLLSQIPVLDVTTVFIQGRLLNLGQPGFFGAIGPNSIPFASWSLGSEGIGPYVAALVIMSVVPVFSTRLRDIAGDPDGRVTLGRYTRALAMLLALGQAYGFTVLYRNTSPPVLLPLDWSARLAVCLALAGGTALMILLADALDEFGLGFGNGALIFYALGPLGSDVHRIADYFAYAPSVDALYWPVALWAACTVGLTAGGVAVLLAVRRVAGTELRLLMSGVLRPPQFALAVVFVPTIVANYYSATYPAQVAWFTYNWGPYGSSLWLDAAYLLIHAGLVTLFALFVVAIDNRLVPMPSDLRGRVTRLALIGGLLLAIGVVAVPAADHFLTRAAGTVIPISGSEVLLLVAMILLTIRAIDKYRPVVPYTASPSGLP